MLRIKSNEDLISGRVGALNKLNGKPMKWAVILALAMVMAFVLFVLWAPPTAILPPAHEQTLQAVVPEDIWERSTRSTRRISGGYLVELSFMDSDARPVIYSYRVRDDLTVTAKQVIIGYGQNFPFNMILAVLFGIFLLCYAALAYRRDQRQKYRQRCARLLGQRPKDQ